MIIEEIVGSRVRHYSDEGVKILQNETGILFDDAVDNLPCIYTYSESDEPSDIDELTDAEAIAIITGGAV